MNDREVMQQALEALDQLTDAVDGTGFSSKPSFTFALDTIDALRAALAAAVAEPLTEVDILRKWRDATLPERHTSEMILAFVRAIERAHGIGEQE